MRASTSMLLGAVSGLIGLALMVVETVRVFNGSSLNTLNNVVLFVGLGLLAVGGVLLVMAVLVQEGGTDSTEPDADPTGDADDADDTEDADEPVEASGQTG